MAEKEVKDKKIRLFRLKTKVVEGYEKVVKTYIHSKESCGLWAYARELSQNERFSAKAVQVEESIEFKIVYNPKIISELFIEFNEKTYNIVSIDKFRFNKTDLVIKANEILAPIFDEVAYENY